MDHNIIHHTTETVPVREPLTVEQADKLIEQFGTMTDTEPLADWQKTFLRDVLTHKPGQVLFLVDGRANSKTRMHQALDRIEEARAHGLA